MFARIRSDHNEDNTSQILQEWTQNVKHLYHRVLINVSGTPSHYDDAEGPGEWTESRYRQMMYLRQRALDSARKQWADYIFVGLYKYIYLINQVRWLYWENISPWSWQYESSTARSEQKRPQANILPVRSRASLVRDLLHDFVLKNSCVRNLPGLILRKYQTGNKALWLDDFSYRPSQLS